ncbi:NAD(P)H-dependent oxidoreductase [Sphingomonas sp. ID0503]|uniref:NAD(P)H-dependent oxidoreductase n=1 Tax=Sphingomonas sp. ID0503 TaxID=3399691 RepID=UPI003AFA18DA
MDLRSLHHVVVLCHPERGESFNRSVAETYCDTVEQCGQRATLRDLYGMNFDPVLRGYEQPVANDSRISPHVEAEMNIIRDCAALTLVYPIWFGTPPAMMKGYMERVLGAGITPRAVENREQSGLSSATLVSITTSANRGAWLAEQGQQSALERLVDAYIAHAFSMRGHEHLHFGSIVPDLGKRFVDEHLAEVRARTRKICAGLASTARTTG